MTTITLARNAMATRFEIVLQGEDSVRLRAAGEAALEEVERLEASLSLFRPGSEIAHVNARAATEPVRVTPAVFELLRHAQQLHAETGGAFDPTVAPLMRCWGFHGGAGRVPSPEQVVQARAVTGMQWVRLDVANFTVRFERPGVMLDLGAIGKGHAIDRAVEILAESGIERALIHGGTSTVYALGSPMEGGAWKVSVENGGRVFATVALTNESLSVSAGSGRCFEAGGKVFGHVMDPRTGEPANRGAVAAVVLPSATETDALSTALLTLGPEGHTQIARLRPGMRTLVAFEAEGNLQVQARGLDLCEWQAPA